jgi:hypothetical protein
MHVLNYIIGGFLLCAIVFFKVGKIFFDWNYSFTWWYAQVMGFFLMFFGVAMLVTHEHWYTVLLGVLLLSSGIVLFLRPDSYASMMTGKKRPNESHTQTKSSSRR